MSMGAAVKLDQSVESFVHAPVRKMLIDGKWVEAASGKTFETPNPATGEVLARVAEGDAKDIDRAVRAARRAFDDGAWVRMRPTERERILLRIAELIESHGDELAQLETLDNGKPFTESRHVDIPGAAATFRYYAGWVTKTYGETNPSDPDYFNFTLREPVGVCGQIIPWNFPLLMAAWKLAPALACGNASVLKPAEQTPLTALRLGELLLEAGVPAGVVNIVPGFGETAGAALVRHPMVDKIAFTGSTEVGKEVHRATADTLKRVSLELGGKSPNIVFSDADPEAAVQGALLGVFFCAGQVCCAGTRLFVEQKMHDQFADQLAKFAGGMKQGDQFDPATRIGPLVSKEQLDRVTGYLEIGKKEGARAIVGGERNTAAGLEKGYFVKPTVFTGVRNDMKIAREEIFGPVVSMIPFKDENDAVLQGNQTTYGLAAGVWTRDVSKAHRVARALRAGTVWVNCYNVFDPAAPFGGYKESGYGRELGRYALDLYTQVKSVWMRI
jgi:acyl-CoA reductase-like NAD-dependent aldehyde dehydrogenase